MSDRVCANCGRTADFEIEVAGKDKNGNIIDGSVQKLDYCESCAFQEIGELAGIADEQIVMEVYDDE
jgi:hypothetical protein